MNKLLRLALFGMLLSGCGSSPGGPTLPPAPPPGPPPPPPPPSGQPTTITIEQRITTLDQVGVKLANLAGTTVEARRAELLSYLRSRTEFEAADVNEDGSLWARFTDGRLLIFPIAINAADEEFPAGLDEARVQGAGYVRATPLGIGRPAVISVPRQRPTAAGPPAELPVSVQARFLEGGEPPGSPSIKAELEALVTSRGYRLAPGAPTGTLDDLKQVSGDGIFWFGGHGGPGYAKDGSRIYAVTSATVISAQNEARYLDLWNDLSIVYGFPLNSLLRPFASTVIGTPSGNRPEDYYAFTKNFVTNHMGGGPNTQAFSDGSLVYIAACSSFDPGFRDAFLAKGAGVYFGWTHLFGPLTDANATKFLFDRMLGTNSTAFNLPQENPDQRAMDYVSVHRDMAGRSLTRYAQARLEYQPGSPSSGLLAPSIQYLSLDEQKGHLILTGKFGTDPGQVKIGGVDLPIESWGREEIKAIIPVDGPQSAGDVVVWSKGRKSNTRRLTDWRPTFRLKFPDPAGAAGGSLKWEGELRVHFRADVSSYREESGQAPKFRVVPFYIAGDSFGELEASGVSEDGNARWEGVSAIGNRITLTSQNLMDGMGEFETEVPALRMWLSVIAQHGMKVIEVETGREFPLVVAWVYDRDNVTLTTPPLPALPAMKVALDNDFSFRSATKRLSPTNPTEIMFWAGYNPQYSPLADLARSPFAASFHGAQRP